MKARPRHNSREMISTDAIQDDEVETGLSIMSLEFLRVDSNFADGDKLDGTMKRQFPPKEYMSLERLLALQDKGEVEIWALYVKKDLVGFTTLRTKCDMAYLFFLALDDPYQGKGYGKEAVKKISQLYADRALAVDFELVDGHAANNE